MQDALTRQVGVTHIKVDIQSNWITIRPPADRYVPLERIAPTIRRAGYDPAPVIIKASGEIRRAERGFEFVITGWPHGYPLTGANLPPEGTRQLEASLLSDRGTVRLKIES